MTSTKQRPRVVVHIGPEKTGTTALAEYLSFFDQRNQLDPSIVFPSGELWFGRAGRIHKHNAELQAVIRSHGQGGITSEQATVLDRLAEVAGADPAVQPVIVLIFEVGLSGGAVEALRDILLDRFASVTFIVAARHQDKSIRSLIAQRVCDITRSATGLTIEYYRQHGGISFESLDYAQIQQQLQSVDKRFELKFIPYLESDPGTMELIRRFFAAAGLPEPQEGKRILDRRIHPSLSQQGVETLSRLKTRIHRWSWFSPVKRHYEKAFEKAWQLFHAAAYTGEIDPDGKVYRPWILSAEDFSWVRARYAESNERFLKQLGRTEFEKEWQSWEQGLKVGGSTQ